jgi:hypothetical protein
MIRTLASLIFLLMLATPAAAAQSFIYVAVAAPPCAAGPACAPGQLVVYDAVTKEVVTTAALGSAQNVPRGMAMSPDGRRLYISLSASDGSASLAVFDTARHQMASTYAVTPAVAGPVAITRDSQRVFVAGSSLVVWDAQTTTVTAVQNQAYTDILTHPALDRVIAGITSFAFGPFLTIYALDETNGVTLASRNADFGAKLTMAADGTRVYDTMSATFIRPSSGGHVELFDPITLNDAGRIGPCPACFPTLTVDAPVRNRVYVMQSAGPTAFNAFDRTTGVSLGSLPVEQRTSMAVVSADERRAWVASFQTPDPGSNPPTRGANVLTVIDLESFTVAGTIPLAASALQMAGTPPPGAARCSYAVNARQSSWTRDGGTATITLSTGCAWEASENASWLHLPADAASGFGPRTFTVTVDPFFGGEAARSASLVIGGQVVTFTQAGFGAQPAFGSFDTPGDNAAGITGSLPVTGWVLDDVGTSRVRITRDAVAGEPAGEVYLGDATFVEGARPDVQAIFPALPFASRAGWGYLLLTNMLPGGGTGTYRLHAYADDVDGHTTFLGSRTFSAANTTASLPFGTIDTPGQGEAVSGIITNWGWALTPQPGFIPTDGSTIDVVIDGVAVGRPTFGFDRADIAALFPGYANTNSAVGYFTIDTRTLSNGVHTIAWVVRDSLGRVQGIGSRYFTVANP